MSKVNEKYASEALLSEEARKKLGLVIRNGSVTTDKLKDGAVTPDKLEPGLWENIDSTNRETQEGLNRLQEWMNEFAGGLEITANTDSYEAGKSASVTITAKTKTGKKGDWIIRDSNNVTVYEKSDASQITYNQTIDKDTYYSIICKQGDQIATGQWAIIAAFPTWLGAGSSYTDIKTDAYKRVVGKKVEGRYEVTIASGQRIYLLTPKEVVISKVTMGGFEIPMNDVEEVTIAISGYGNKVYKVYESSNTYQEGTYQVSVNVSDSELVEHIEAIDRKIDNYPVADGEDIVAVTKTQPTEQQVLMLADKAYHPASFSGLGRKYLRKNIIPIEHEYRVFGGFVENVVVQAVGATITDGNNSNVVYDRIRKEFLYMDKKDLSTPAKYYNVWTSEEVLYSDYYQSSFATGYTIRTDVVFMYNGVPYKWNGENLLVDNEIQEDGLMNLLTQDMINEPNTIYHIQYDYDLNGQSITVPEGCTLEFEGGSLRNGTLIGNDLKFTGNYIKAIKVIINGIILNDVFEFTDSGNSDVNESIFSACRGLIDVIEDVKFDRTPTLNANLTSSNGKTITFEKDLNYGMYCTKSHLKIYRIKLIKLIPELDASQPTTRAWHIEVIRCVNNEDITIEQCEIYGGIRHGMKSVSSSEATKLSKLNGFFILNNKITADFSNIADGNRDSESNYVQKDAIAITGINNVHIENNVILANHVNRVFQTGGDVVTTDLGENYENAYNIPTGIYIKDNYIESKGNSYCGQFYSCYPGNINVYIEGNTIISENHSSLLDNKYKWGTTYKSIFSIRNNNIKTDCRISFFFISNDDTLFFEDNNIIFNGTSETVTAGYADNKLILINTTNGEKIQIKNNKIAIDSDLMCTILIARSTITNNRTEFIFNDNNINNLYSISISPTDTVLPENSQLFSYAEIRNNWIKLYTGRTIVFYVVNTTALIDTLIAEDSAYEKETDLDNFLISFSGTKFGKVIVSTGERARLLVFSNKQAALDAFDHIYSNTYLVAYNTGVRPLSTLPLSINNLPTKATKYACSLLNNQMVIWNGTKWVDADGFTAALCKGTTAQRPTATLSNNDAGYQYFDTTLGKPIYLKVTGGVKSWVDATGAEV